MNSSAMCVSAPTPSGLAIMLLSNNAPRLLSLVSELNAFQPGCWHQVGRDIMSSVISYEDAVSRLASQSGAVGHLAQDSGAFAAVVAAFESKDPDAFRWVLE